LMNEVVRPVAWGEKEVRGVVEALNKILVESLNADGLRKSILALRSEADVKKLGGMKLLERWLAIAYPSIDASAVVCPFFVLNDFRMVVAHLIPADAAEKKLDACYERMGLPSESRTVEALYDGLIASLTQSYKVLLSTVKAGG